MKKIIRKWLGIEALEKIVGKPEKKASSSFWSYAYMFPFWETERDESLVGKYERLLADFNELDKKFDELEKYLQIEYFKTEEETQVYDWADKEKKEGFRKTKPYEEIKKLKEASSSENDDD